MRHRRLSRRILLAALVVPLLGALAIGDDRPEAVRAPRRPFHGTLSLLTYNVEGLPWPAASGRTGALRSIAAQLLAMRRQGTNPDVVMLQEAFTDEARAIGGEAGYRYVVEGPASTALSDVAATESDRQFLSAASLRKGETEGKLVGSGLMILSDYPILSVRRIAWPAFACAGLDCLANKGAMFAVVAPPGASSPIDVVTTHLNSRRRAGVPIARSLKAYRRQTGLLALFVRRWHDPSRPIVIAGDFNVHDSSTRLAALLPAVASCCGSQPVRDALHEAAARGLKLSVAAESVLRLGRDWQFFAPGTRARLELTGAHTLFGPDLAGSTPSDHVAYEATFRLVPAGHPPGLMGKAPGSISPNMRGHSPA